MREQVGTGRRVSLPTSTAQVVIYEAFVKGKLEAPKHVARTVHDLYFEPKYKQFRPRTIWNLSNAFTSALKELDPIPLFRATMQLGSSLETIFTIVLAGGMGDRHPSINLRIRLRSATSRAQSVGRPLQRRGPTGMYNPALSISTWEGDG